MLHYHIMGHPENLDDIDSKIHYARACVCVCVCEMWKITFN
jgi:hypothetical protein